MTQVLLRYQFGHPTSFPSLPQGVGQKETHTLKEQCETNPLIEFVLHNLLLIVQHRSNSRMRNFPTYLSFDMFRQGERGVNPAVGVHHTLRNGINNTVNWVSEKLPNRHESARDKDDEGGHLAVEPEDRVVYPYLRKLDIMLQWFEQVCHSS